MATLKHKTAGQVLEEKRQSKIRQARKECTRRIESHWDKHGQVNAAIGVYSEDEQQACKECIETHRQALQDLISEIEESDDPKAIDVSDDQWWE